MSERACDGEKMGLRELDCLEDECARSPPARREVHDTRAAEP